MSKYHYVYRIVFIKNGVFLALCGIIGRNSLILKEKIATKIQVILAFSNILDKIKFFRWCLLYVCNIEKNAIIKSIRVLI